LSLLGLFVKSCLVIAFFSACILALGGFRSFILLPLYYFLISYFLFLCPDS
jgi:hypothetical protein